MILGLVVTLGAGVLLADDVKLDRSVMGAGGGVQVPSGDGKYFMSSMVGQTAIEVRSLDGMELSQGFWVKGGKATGINDNTNVISNSNLSNYPNPFSNSTTVQFDLNASSYVTVKIYDMLGNNVKTLFDGMKDAGQAQFGWDARNDAGVELTSGSYIYEVTVHPTSSSDASSYTLRNVMVIVK